MAHYLVRAKPKSERLAKLREQLARDAFVNLRPFGRTLTHSLNNARVGEDGLAVWEEEDYCSPPLAEERAAVLDEYVEEIEVERVEPREGWRRIAGLPPLLPPGKEPPPHIEPQ